MKSSESIALCFPTDGSGYVVALRAFFDASEQGGVFSVAGFAYGLSNANKAQNAWVGAHGKRVVHMADVHAHKEDFENISNVEAGEITVKSIEIISKYMKFGVAASCDLNEMPHTFQIPVTGDRFIDTIAKGFGSPYAWCCHTVMHHIGKMVERAGGGNDEVTCIFETGDR